MNPRKNQTVNVFFKNGVTIRGVVVEWSDEKSALRAIQTRNLIIIYNTLENVQMVCIELEQAEEKKKTPSPVPSQIVPKLSNPRISAPAAKITAPDFATHTKKIAELRLLKVEAEKKEVIERARTFQVSSPSPRAPYATPSFLKQPK